MSSPGKYGQCHSSDFTEFQKPKVGPCSASQASVVASSRARSAANPHPWNELPGGAADGTPGFSQ